MPSGQRNFALALSLSLVVACHGAPAGGSAADDERSVKPGINDPFLDPAMRVADYQERFEGESREIFAQRARIAGLLDLQPGTVVADIGAGTGLFTRMFAQRVGDAGRVYAVEIAPKFVEHLQRDAAARGLRNVVAVQCTERSAELPEASIDVAFVCDTYHHFEYPQHTLASIRRALRPGGTLVVVDFIRIPGQSRDWILDHVRAGQDVVTGEIEQAGFDKVRDEATPFLRENYAMRFRRR